MIRSARLRVLAAMAELDYRVNNAARTLGTRTTRTLGVIASDATLYGPAVGIAALLAFVLIWAMGLRHVERGEERA